MAIVLTDWLSKIKITLDFLSQYCQRWILNEISEKRPFRLIVYCFLMFVKFQFNYYLFNYSTDSSRLDMCRRNYPTDVCNRGTAGKCNFIAGTTIITWLCNCFFQTLVSIRIKYHGANVQNEQPHTFHTIDVQTETF